jgi:hypothetical protein
MTVKKPRRRKAPIEGSTTKTFSAVKLDPATEPNWYLRDTTLRRGDIVVTRSGILVYKGRDSDTLRGSDFASLSSSAAGRAWRYQLELAAKGGRSYF